MKSCMQLWLLNHSTLRAVWNSSTIVLTKKLCRVLCQMCICNWKRFYPRICNLQTILPTPTTPPALCGSLTHFCPPFQHLLSERLTSLGIMGAPRVPPLNPPESIVLSEHYRLWGRDSQMTRLHVALNKNDCIFMHIYIYYILGQNILDDFFFWFGRF